MTKATYKNGYLEGQYERYYENGQLKIKKNGKDRKQCGPYEEYYENGQLKKKGTYKDYFGREVIC